MGACSSCKRSKTRVPLKTIRVVQMDGSLEDYQDPATVDQVIINFPKHFLCTPIQILQDGLIPLKHDHQLKTGQIYFMLPNSTLKFNASPMDLVSLTKKLTKIAKTSRCLPKLVPTSPLASPLWDPKARSPNRGLALRCVGDGMEKMAVSVPKSPPWKPNLTMIRERSVDQRGESLGDEHFGDFDHV
ncbi:Protein of unknown function DUF4228 [Cynara cardunculus var. scolymus]|uniref:Uncharacterized protein n=1 Tax=Cynara cardunculus var. scolymus TaxID=59895 RepID=A0A103YME6_CYNCS|nr:Protein of unknown function DUF4228 [Cynara cardunculus var. scolymus]